MSCCVNMKSKSIIALMCYAGFKRMSCDDFYEFSNYLFDKSPMYFTGGDWDDVIDLIYDYPELYDYRKDNGKDYITNEYKVLSPNIEYFMDDFSEEMKEYFKRLALNYKK